MTRKLASPALVPAPHPHDAEREDGLAGTVSVGADTSTDCISLYVFIAYDDRPAFNRALHTLLKVAQELDDDRIELCPLPWRMDVLAEESCRALAIEDAAKAVIIVLSTSAVEAPPETFQAWLPACLGRRSDTTQAVMAMLGAPDCQEGPESPRLQFVRHAARNAGCDLIGPTSLTAALTPLSLATVSAQS